MDIGGVVSLWRYPVKSMMGEELNASEVTARGLLGDRAYALVDADTGKVASAKNPRKWPNLFQFRAAYVEPPRVAEVLPPVRVTLPDGTLARSDEQGVREMLSQALGRAASLRTAGIAAPSLEEYWPDIEGLDHQDTVTDEAMPEQTFFDAAEVHVLTTATLDRLRSLTPGSRFEVRRFRPNVVVDVEGGDGFVENDWVGKTLRLGDVTLEVFRGCPRCVMTTLAQGDLPKDSDILRTAARHNGTNVGVYAHAVGAGTVRRGDAVSLGD